MDVAERLDSSNRIEGIEPDLAPAWIVDDRLFVVSIGGNVEDARVGGRAKYRPPFGIDGPEILRQCRSTALSRGGGGVFW